jgi:hypothetical protein
MTNDLALELVSAVTIILSVAAKGGVVGQFINNHRTYCDAKTSHLMAAPVNLSMAREAIYVASYTAWVVYGVLIGSTVIIINQGLGVLAEIVLVAQVIWVRRRVRAIWDSLVNEGLVGAVNVVDSDASPTGVMYAMNMNHPAMDRVG